MIDKIIDLIYAILSDHNIVLAALFVLAILTPELRDDICAGMLGYWTKTVTQR